MFRAIILLAVGVAVGALGVLHLVDGDRAGADGAMASSSESTELARPPASDAERIAARSGERGDLLATTASDDDGGAPQNANGGYASQRLALYEQAAALGDPGAVADRIEDAALQPRSASRDLEIGALLARFSELDPLRAMRLAQSLLIDDDLVVATFTAAAGTIPDAVLAELAAVRRPALQRDVALALLDVLGNDDRVVEGVTAALPASLRPLFEVNVLAKRAERDPASAVRAALRLDNPLLQQMALSSIGAVAATRDPREIIALAASIDDESLASGFRSAALSAWARSDPHAALDYLEAAGPMDLVTAIGVVSPAASAAPQRVLAMLDRLPAEYRSSAQQTAIRALAQSDPLQTMRLVDTMPAGQERDNVVQTIAQNYARQDPDAAIAWVQSLQPPPRDALRAIIQGIASVDFNRAVDMTLSEFGGQGRGGGPSLGFVSGNVPIALSNTSLILPLVLSQRNAQNTEGMTRLAEGLLATNSPEARAAFSTMMSAWTQVDTERAADWMLANIARVPIESLGNAAQQLARTDVERAMRMTDQLAGAARVNWISGVAGGMAQNDLPGATRWIERFRGQPGYDAAMVMIIQQGAQNDPAGAARLLAGASPAAQAQAAPQLVSRWSQQDPPAAARWAETIADEAVRASTVNMAARQWAQGDASAAERWAHALSNQATRDGALGGVFAGAAASGAPDTRILDAMSSDQLRQQAVMNAIFALGRTDPDAARRLIAGYVTEPVLRRQAEQALAQATGQSISTGFTIIN